MTIKWEEEYSLGIRLIDSQHKKWIKTLNRLDKVIHSLKLSSIIKDTIKDFENYSNYHLSTEEKYFKKFNYKSENNHLKIHNKFRKYIEKLKKESKKKDKMKLAFKLIDFMEDWLINHIMIEDKKYVKCFRENGLK